MLALLGLPSAGSIAKAIFSTAISAALTLLADEVKLILGALFSFINSTTEPVFTSGWWTGAGHELWLEVLALSGAIAVMALMLAALEGIVSGTAAPMALALRAVPMAVVKTAVLVSVTSLLVTGTDQIANYLDGSILSEVGPIPTGIAAAISATGLVGMIFAAVIVLAVLGLWAELAVRAAVLYLVVMTAPMVIAASIHPRVRHSWSKLAEIGAGVIFSKILVALALRIAFAELAGLTSSPSFSEAISALVTGIATLVISCFAPFVLFRLFSIEVSHLEGLARRPTRAVRDAQQVAYYNKNGLGSFLNRHGSAGSSSDAESGTSGGAAGSASGGAGKPGGGPKGGPTGGGGGGSGAAGAGAGAGAGAATGAAGAAGAAATAAAGAAKKAGETVKGAASSAAQAATSAGQPSASEERGRPSSSTERTGRPESGPAAETANDAKGTQQRLALDGAEAERGSSGTAVSRPSRARDRTAPAGESGPRGTAPKGAVGSVTTSGVTRRPGEPESSPPGPLSARDAVRDAAAGSMHPAVSAQPGGEPVAERSARPARPGRPPAPEAAETAPPSRKEISEVRGDD